MDEKELIKYLKTLIAVTKDSNVKMKELETGVEISVEMAEQLIGIIEKLRIKNGKEFVRGMKTEYKVWRTKIRSKIKELKEKATISQGEELLIIDAKTDMLEELLEE